MAKKKINAWDYFDEEKLKDGIENALNDVLTGDYGYETDEYIEYLLDTITPDSAGTYQPSEAASFFDLSIDDYLDEDEKEELPDDEDEAWNAYEFSWEIIEDVAGEIAEQMNSKLSDFLFKHGNAGLHIGHFGDTGDFGLVVLFDKAEIGGWEDRPLGKYAKSRR